MLKQILIPLTVLCCTPAVAVDFEANRRVLLINAYQMEGVASGTGFYVEMPNHTVRILTNRHVCRNAISYNAKSQSEQVFRPITLIKESVANTDLCLMMPSPGMDMSVGGYRLAELPAPVGTHFVSYGFPMRSPLSMNEGVITAYNRLSIMVGDWFSGMFVMHTTEPNIPGSSGSPVLNERGELIGVVVGTEGLNTNHPTGLAVPLTSVQQFLRRFPK